MLKCMTPNISPKAKQKVPNMFLPYWRLTKELPSTHGRKRATWTKQYSSTSPRQQGNQNHYETSNTQFLNYSNIMILNYWICDIRYMIYDVWYMMWLYYLYGIWYVMHMLICSSLTITLCCSHLRWVGMPDMGRLGFSTWVTSKKSFNFFWISPWFAHHETKKWSK